MLWCTSWKPVRESYLYPSDGNSSWFPSESGSMLIGTFSDTRLSCSGTEDPWGTVLFVQLVPISFSVLPHHQHLAVVNLFAHWELTNPRGFSLLLCYHPGLVLMRCLRSPAREFPRWNLKLGCSLRTHSLQFITLWHIPHGVVVIKITWPSFWPVPPKLCGGVTYIAEICVIFKLLEHNSWIWYFIY